MNNGKQQRSKLLFQQGVDFFAFPWRTTLKNRRQPRKVPLICFDRFCLGFYRFYICAIQISYWCLYDWYRSTYYLNSFFVSCIVFICVLHRLLYIYIYIVYSFYMWVYRFYIIFADRPRFPSMTRRRVIEKCHREALVFFSCLNR